ncbi:MAG: IS1 family transposase [Firmicutes bacterium]|nr:IS1 family transposase [Bacillota bacterium]
MGLADNKDNLLLQIMSERFEEGVKCPHCKSTYVIKHGKYQGKQRYKYKEYQKTLSDVTLTPFEYSKKSLIK